MYHTIYYILLFLYIQYTKIVLFKIAIYYTIEQQCTAELGLVVHSVLFLYLFVCLTVSNKFGTWKNLFIFYSPPALNQSIKDRFKSLRCQKCPDEMNKSIMSKHKNLKIQPQKDPRNFLNIISNI